MVHHFVCHHWVEIVKVIYIGSFMALDCIVRHLVLDDNRRRRRRRMMKNKAKEEVR